MKTKSRNRLNTDTVSGTLLAAQCIKEGTDNKEGNCCNFQPTKDMLRRMRSDILYKEKKKDGEKEEEDNNDTEVYFLNDD